MIGYDELMEVCTRANVAIEQHGPANEAESINAWIEAADIEPEELRRWAHDLTNEVLRMLLQVQVTMGPRVAFQSAITYGFQIGWTAAILHSGVGEDVVE